MLLFWLQSCCTKHSHVYPQCVALTVFKHGTNRWFLEITGEYFLTPGEWSPLRVGHHFRYGLDLHTGIYRSMISEWRQQLRIAGLWQYQTFRHGPLSIYIYTGLPAVRYAWETLFLCMSFWWGHMQCVHLEWRTDWIDCERSLFTPCSWLRRRNV